jgi:hypothetical protein
MDMIIPAITALFGGGLVGFLNWFLAKSKNKNDISTSNIEAATRLRDIAMENYLTVEGKITKIKAELVELEKELQLANKYIDVLCDMLTTHGIEVPERKTSNRG